MTLEYLAGFLDGEGCITTYKTRKGHVTWEVVCVQTEKNNLAPLVEMQERWGGSLCARGNTNPKHSRAWQWSVKGLEAAIALSDIYLHLVNKRPKATEALEALMGKPRIRRIVQRMGEPKP